jgi:hypothetical protein
LTPNWLKDGNYKAKKNAGVIVMDEKAVGFLLSSKEWNKVLNGKITNYHAILYRYADYGRKKGLTFYFFKADEMDVNSQKGRAFVVEEDSIIEHESVAIPAIIYNPTKFSRKRFLRTLEQIREQPKIFLINEHNSIKNDCIFDIICSNQELIKYISEGKEKIDNKELFLMIGQKDVNHTWTLSDIYIQKLNGEIYHAYEKDDPFLLREMQLEILDAGKNILEMIHYYFPGLYEVGLKFYIDKDGAIKFYSTCSLFSVLRGIGETEEKLLNQVINYLIDFVISKYEMQTHCLDGNSSPQNIVSNNGLHKGTFWIKIKPFKEEDFVVKVPHRMTRELSNIPVSVTFGVKRVECHFQSYDDPILLKYNSLDDPVEIFISDALIKKLHIPLDMVYQIMFSDETILFGPSIGILLGENNHNYNLKYMEKFSDRFGAYHRFGGITIAFSPRSINWEEMIAYGMVYDDQKKGWRYGSAPIPAAIYRRNFHQSPKLINKLIEITNHQLFNSYHFTKADLIHLKDEFEIKSHLPSTFILIDFKDLQEFILENKKVILKPVNLSRGRGIFIVESEENGFFLTDYSQSVKSGYKSSNYQDICKLLRELGVHEQSYLYQTYIPLLKVFNRSFDVRVVMQKYNDMKWICSGIECRVAKENEELTNISRGGDAMTLEDVIRNSNNRLSYSEVEKNILKLCQNFCSLINKQNHHFAEFGLDIALDENGYPWILEANIFPSFKGFKHLDYDTYLKIRYQPLLYAVELQGFSILEETQIVSKYEYIGKYNRL